MVGPRIVDRTAAALVSAAVVCGLAAVVLVVATAPDERAQRGLVEALIVGVPIAGGLATLRSEGDRRFSLLLIAAGLTWSLTALGQASQSLLYSVGRVSAWLIFPLLVYLMLAFPSGRVRRGLDIDLLAAVTGLITLLYIGSALFVEAYPRFTPWATCDLDCPANAFLVLDHEPAVMQDVVVPLREILGGVVLLAVTARLAHRAVTGSALHRRVVAPVALTSAVSALVLIAYFVARRTAGDDTVEAVGTLWSLTVPGVTAAFLVGLLRRRATAGEVLTRLSVELGGRHADAGVLRESLSAALDDPSLDVVVPDRSVTPPADGRVVTHIDGGAALIHSPSLLEDPALLRAVGALVRSTLRQERVLDELAVSRKRIARAADVERSRIERDLHDGAQQRLIGLRIRLSLAEELVQADPAAGVEAMHELGDEVERTLEELRSLAHGVYPALLSDRGLGDALASVLAESPVPVHLVTEHLARYPPEIETAVYFTCLEAVQNAIKHGRGATGLWLTLNASSGLRFEVRDDGAGFVPPTGEHNGGLRNMRDRIEAIGGRLAIESAPGEGARVRGTVPLR